MLLLYSTLDCVRRAVPPKKVGCFALVLKLILKVTVQMHQLSSSSSSENQPRIKKPHVKPYESSGRVWIVFLESCFSCHWRLGGKKGMSKDTRIRIPEAEFASSFVESTFGMSAQ